MNINFVRENLILVENKLYVPGNVSLSEMMDLVAEYETVGSEHDEVFEVEAFVIFNNMPECMLCNLKNLPAGGQFTYNEYVVKKVTDNLCVAEINQARRQSESGGNSEKAVKLAIMPNFRVILNVEDEHEESKVVLCC